VPQAPGTGARKEKLKVLSAADVQRFYRAKLDSGLSSATVHKLHVVLHKALKRAVRWGLVACNVADDVDPPKVHKEEVSPPSNDEARRLLDAVEGDLLEALYVVAVQSGLRQGELLALKWKDVNLEARTVQVRRTLTRDGGKLTVGPTKTSTGRLHRQAYSGRHRSVTGTSGAAARRDRQGWQ
jgi:integrase